MKFKSSVAQKYRQSVEDAFAVILEKGNEMQRFIAKEILASEMLMNVAPVSEINASGITGLINSLKTNSRIDSERLNLREALGEVYIAIAEETIDLGGQRGCEGTLIHEGRHAYDFAQTISSFSEADVNPLSIFNPTLYELEWEAHKTSGDYMIRIGQEEYLKEGLELMILKNENGVCEVCDDGINRRLHENYHLDLENNPGKTAAKLLRLNEKD
jgi:hypothetical protein